MALLPFEPEPETRAQPASFDAWLGKYALPNPYRKVDLIEDHLRSQIKDEITSAEIDFEVLKGLVAELEWLHTHREAY